MPHWQNCPHLGCINVSIVSGEALGGFLPGLSFLAGKTVALQNNVGSGQLLENPEAPENPRRSEVHSPPPTHTPGLADFANTHLCPQKPELCKQDLEVDTSTEPSCHLGMGTGTKQGACGAEHVQTNTH